MFFQSEVQKTQTVTDDVHFFLKKEGNLQVIYEGIKIAVVK